MLKTSFALPIVVGVSLSVAGGAIAGAVSGELVSSRLEKRLAALAVSVPTSTTPTTPVTTSTTPTFSVVPLERRGATPLVPPAFIKRGSPSLASLYRKAKGTTFEERLLGEDRLLGQTVALTSDGWFVTTEEAIGDVHLADLTVLHDGKAYPVTRGVIDHLTGTVFLKTTASNLIAPGFARIQDLSMGAEMWLEARPGEFAPHVVMALDARESANEPVSSEVADRRLTLNGVAMAGDRGSAVWDPNGTLVGIVESGAGEGVRVIPISGIAASFTSLLVNSEIRHAQLGVRTLDLASIRLDGSRGELPLMGAYIHEDKKVAKPGVVKDSAAAKAKLRVGDVILRVEHDILDGSADIGEILADYRPGATVTLRILRTTETGTSDLDVPVTLGSVLTSELLR